MVAGTARAEAAALAAGVENIPGAVARAGGDSGASAHSAFVEGVASAVTMVWSFSRAITDTTLIEYTITTQPTLIDHANATTQPARIEDIPGTVAFPRQ